jgi:predicted dehydrogenase
MAPHRQHIAVGVIGAGFMAQVAHLPALSRAAGCRIVALSDNRPDVLEAVAERYGIGSRAADYRDLLAGPPVEAVVVSMPRRAQSAVLRRVLQAGRPVLTEKPMAYTARVADELVALAEAGSVPLAVGYMRRLDRGVALFRSVLAKAIREGAMGALLHVRMADFCGAYTGCVPDHLHSAEPRPFRYEEDPVTPDFLDPALRAAYDYTVNVASHDINLLRYLLGDPLEPISFRARPGKVQHAVFAAPGSDVELTVGPAKLGRWEQSIDIYFAKGRLGLTLASPLDFEAAATVVRQTASDLEVLAPPDSGAGGAFDRQAVDFLDGLRLGAAFATGGRDAARDVAIIESLWRIANIA